MPSRRAFLMAPIARLRAVPIEGLAGSPSGDAFSLPDCNPPRAMPGLERILELVLAMIGVVAVVTALALAL